MCLQGLHGSGCRRGLIPTNPAVSDTVPLRDPTALPKHQGVSGTRAGTTGRSEGHGSFSRKTSNVDVEELPVIGGQCFHSTGVPVAPKIIATSSASHQPLSGQGGPRTEIPSRALQIPYRISSYFILIPISFFNVVVHFCL